MTLKNIEEIFNKFPDFKREWKIKIIDVNGKKVIKGFVNKNMGSIDFMVHCDEQGNLLYDQPVITQGIVNDKGQCPLVTGSVIIPFKIKGKNIDVGLVKVFRSVVKDALSGKRGVFSWEFPRGFSDVSDKVVMDTAIRELGEETDLRAKNIYRLGNGNTGINLNTSLFSNYVSVWAVEVERGVLIGEKDSKEQIQDFRFFKYQELKEMIFNGEIICGMTLAGFMLFDVFLREIL